MRTVDVVLPAGGRIQGEFAGKAGAGVKALIPFEGVTVLERTIRLLRATGRVGRITVIGPEEVLRHPSSELADGRLPQAGSDPGNLLRGLEWLRETDGGKAPDRVLAIAADLPFLTSRAVSEFLDACPESIDACVPVVRGEMFRLAFPGTGNPFVRLHDGEWMLGGAFLARPAVLAANRGPIERMFQNRGSRMGLARLLGPGDIVRHLAGRLTIDRIEARCRTLLGCSGRIIAGCAPELAYDIDLPGDYHYAASLIAARYYHAVSPVPYSPTASTARVDRTPATSPSPDRRRRPKDRRRPGSSPRRDRCRPGSCRSATCTRDEGPPRSGG